MKWFERLYEAATGTPYWTGRTLSDEWHEHGGPPPGEKYKAEFAGMSDEEILRHGMDIVRRNRRGV